MFSIRLKLLLVLILAVVLGLLFVQNQQLITLKFFCANLQGACLYRSPNFPLAVWLGVFIFTGIVTNLIWQLLNSLNTNTRSARVSSQPYTSVRENETYVNEREGYRNNLPDWEQPSRDDWNIEAPPSNTDTVAPLGEEKFTTQERDLNYQSETTQPKTEYEVKQQPSSVQRSGSTYSYQYRQAENKQPETSQVYDANYRTLNSPNPIKPSESTTNDDDEDWV